ncbi:MAG: DUF2817 domain-containing protein [Spirochaetales bacterium]|nr:DUF2817 domain-containing protein [Spirochaetales bacterium]
MAVSYSRLFFLPCLLILLVFFSCSLQNDGDDDIRILPGYIEEELVAFTIRAPLITELRITGYSSGPVSYPIYALKMTDNPQEQENEPEIQFTGGIHGNEQLSCIMVLRMIEYMIDLYEEDDPVITGIINNSELHFSPVLNPYGLSRDERYNANSVDLNRNFSWAWVDGLFHGDAPIDQPESQAIRDDALEHPYVLAVHGHTGAACINTLWDYIGTTKSSGTPSTYTIDDFISLYLPSYPFISEEALHYKNTVNAAGDDGFWMTEGYDWYAAFGTLQDWMYGVRGAIAYTLEYDLSSGHTLLYEELFQEVFDNHKDALIDLFIDARKGISGIITGSGELPVDAKVEVTTVTKSVYCDPVTFSPFCFTDPDAGDYHLPVQPGTYNLEITADGYLPETINGIVVPEETGIVIRNIQLTPGKGEKSPLFMPPEIPADNIPPDLREE